MPTGRSPYLSYHFMGAADKGGGCQIREDADSSIDPPPVDGVMAKLVRVESTHPDGEPRRR